MLSSLQHVDGSFSVKPLKQKQIVSLSEEMSLALLIQKTHVHTHPVVSGDYSLCPPRWLSVASDRPVDLSVIVVGSGKSGSGSSGVCIAYPPCTAVLTVVALSLVQCEHHKLSVTVR